MEPSTSVLSPLEKELQCPICQELLTDPVSLDCGHAFCRGCITQYCEKWEDLGDLACPLCKAKIKKRNFRPNWQLANAAEEIKALTFKIGLMCGRHNATLNLFCKEDKELVCSICERSPEHQSHTILLLEDAATEYKDQFRRSLLILEKEREKILENQTTIEKESEDLHAETKAKKEKTVTEFRQLRQFLEEEENRLLGLLECVEKETAHSRDEHLARLSSKLSSLDSLIQELQQKQEQSASELLKDVGRTLQRCEKIVAFSPALKWRNWEISDINFSLEGVIKQFKEALISQPNWQKVPAADVPLEPGTVHPEPLLSEHCKSMREGGVCPDLPNNPKAAMLGHAGFTEDKHFQEVDVGIEEPFINRVINQPSREKGYFVLSPEGGIKAMGKRSEQDHPFLGKIPLRKELRRIHSDEKAIFDAGEDRSMLVGPLRDRSWYRSSMSEDTPFHFPHSPGILSSSPTSLSHFTHSTNPGEFHRMQRSSSLQSSMVAPSLPSGSPQVAPHVLGNHKASYLHFKKQ